MKKNIKNSKHTIEISIAVNQCALHTALLQMFTHENKIEICAVYLHNFFVFPFPMKRLARNLEIRHLLFVYMSLKDEVKVNFKKKIAVCGVVPRPNPKCSIPQNANFNQEKGQMSIISDP